MRRKQRTSIGWALIAWVGLAVTPVSAGVVYEIEVRDHEQSPPTNELIEAVVEGRHLKMGIAAGQTAGKGDMIFSGERREIVVVDHQNQSYMVLDEDAVERIGGQVNSAMTQMQEALKNVPEDRRKMVEQMMKQRMPQAESGTDRDKSLLVKTSERAEMAGYPCVKYEVLRGGQKVRELWVTDWSNLEGGDEVVGAFEDLADFFRELMNSIPQMGGGAEALDDSFVAHMRELGGFPVVTREFNDEGDLEAESTLRGASRRTLDPDAFEPPSGYKRQEMFSPQGQE